MSVPEPDSPALSATTTIQVTIYVREQLAGLADSYQKDERLSRRPTFDDVIRRLLARDRLAGQYGGQQ